nr:hypothetical protein [Mycoplasmopsis bovis]
MAHYQVLKQKLELPTSLFDETRENLLFENQEKQFMAYLQYLKNKN